MLKYKNIEIKWTRRDLNPGPPACQAPFSDGLEQAQNPVPYVKLRDAGRTHMAPCTEGLQKIAMYLLTPAVSVSTGSPFR